MSTTTQQPATNDLRHTINTVDKDGNTMIIKIRINDECKNGHQDFAITATIWEKGKPKVDKYWIMGGCCHDEILASCPDLKIFVDLHLCDYKGIPMHAVENGFYHLCEGFNDTKPGSEKFKNEFCEYYRISSTQFDVISRVENKLQYALALQNLNILDQWADQANSAIELLQEMTGKVFLIDSKRTQYNAPTPEELQKEKEKQESGYYTTEAKQKRILNEKKKERAKILIEYNSKITNIEIERDIKLQLFDIGGPVAVSNTIFYTHTKQIKFNWQRDDKKPLSEELISKIKAEMKLPDGVTFEN